MVVLSGTTEVVPFHKIFYGTRARSQERKGQRPEAKGEEPQVR